MDYDIKTKVEDSDYFIKDDPYYTYVRGEITDWTSDKNLFEHEEKRKPSGHITLRNHYEQDVPDSPDLFLDFIGTDNVDPRGYNVDPDMQQLRSQNEFRNKYHRFTAENDQNITSGNASETKMIEIRKDAYGQMSKNMILKDNPEILGPTPGIQYIPKKKSCANKSIVNHNDRTSEHITNEDSIVHKSQIKYCKKNVNKKSWRNDTASNLSYYQYGSMRTKSGKQSNKSSVIDTRSYGGQQEFSGSSYKSAGMIMSNMVNFKSSSSQGHTDGRQSLNFQAKSKENMNKVLENIKHDIELQNSKEQFHSKSSSIKSKYTPGISDNRTSAHENMAKELMFKTIKNKVIKPLNVTNDAVDPLIRDLFVIAKKNSDNKNKGIINVNYDTDATESKQTYNYATGRRYNGDKNMRLVTDDSDKSESVNTQYRKQSHVTNNDTAIDKVDSKTYGNNTGLLRMTGKLGKKYLNKYVDRDSTINDLL